MSRVIVECPACSESNCFSIVPKKDAITGKYQKQWVKECTRCGKRLVATVKVLNEVEGD